MDTAATTRKIPVASSFLARSAVTAKKLDFVGDHGLVARPARLA
jgi:hypothetical protein